MSTIRRSTRSRTSVRRHQTKTSPNNTRRTKGRAGKSGKRRSGVRSGKKGSGRSVQKSKIKPRRSSKRVTKNARQSRGSRTSAVSRRVHRNRCVDSKRLRGGVWSSDPLSFIKKHLPKAFGGDKQSSHPEASTKNAEDSNWLSDFLSDAKHDFTQFLTKTLPDNINLLKPEEIARDLFDKIIFMVTTLYQASERVYHIQKPQGTEETHYQKFKSILGQTWSQYQHLIQHMFGADVKNNVGSQIGALLGALYSDKDTGLIRRAINLGVGYQVGKTIDANLQQNNRSGARSGVGSGVGSE